jgi:hypothetical protein
MMPPNSQRPVFGQPGWRRRMEAQYGWDKEFKAAGIILLLIFLSLAFAHADGDTGLPGDDQKDLGPVRPEVSTTSCVSEMVAFRKNAAAAGSPHPDGPLARS